MSKTIYLNAPYFYDMIFYYAGIEIESYYTGMGYCID